jgi:hypothetical protein
MLCDDRNSVQSSRGATHSDNRRPQPGVTVAREVTDILRRDNHLITSKTNSRTA